MNKASENTVRNYAILLLMILATYLNDFKIAMYCLIAGGVIGVIYKLSFIFYDNSKQ